MGLYFSTNYREASMAAATKRVYASLWRAWECYAVSEDVPALPADPLHIGRYLEHRARSGDRVSTIKLRRAAIGQTHAANGYENPTNCHSIRTLLRGISRTHGEDCSQAQGLTAEDMEHIRAVAREGRDRENLAICYVMRDALLRRSEAAALRWEDVTLEDDGSGRLVIRRSKTDQTARGEEFYISSSSVLALQAIMPKNPTGSVFRISDRTVGRRIKAICDKAGLAGNYSGHSPRVGMAQDLVAGGAGLPELQQVGRWKSTTMPVRYARHLQARRSAVAKYYKR